MDEIHIKLNKLLEDDPTLRTIIFSMGSAQLSYTKIHEYLPELTFSEFEDWYIETQALNSAKETIGGNKQLLTDEQLVAATGGRAPVLDKKPDFKHYL